MLSIVRRLVKYQDHLNDKAKEEGKKGETKTVKDVKKGKSDKVEPSIRELEETLHEKTVSLEGLQTQVENLEKYYDEMNKPLPSKEVPESEKKVQ